MSNTLLKSKLEDISKRAEIRKKDSSLRHVPSEVDIYKVSENTKEISFHQFKTIKSST